MEETGANGDISSIVILKVDESKRFVPPLSDYDLASPGWHEAEYRWLAVDKANLVVGFWTGEPGTVVIEQWPCTEVCTILSGRVAIRDSNGHQIEFAAGSAFIIPKGWRGQWLTLESSSKVFAMID